ncbi:MAG TPA: hypothetical protein VJH69_01175 [Candidatus Paceibacterota bacterium]
MGAYTELVQKYVSEVGEAISLDLEGCKLLVLQISEMGSDISRQDIAKKWQPAELVAIAAIYVLLYYRAEEKEKAILSATASWLMSELFLGSMTEARDRLTDLLLGLSASISKLH